MWKNKYSLVEVFNDGNLISNTEQIYSEKVAYSDFFINLWSMLQNGLSVQLLEDAEYGVIVKDSKGYLHFSGNDIDITNFAQNTIDFSNKLQEKNIPFLYIQAPNKYLKGYTDEIVSEYNFSKI